MDHFLASLMSGPVLVLRSVPVRLLLALALVLVGVEAHADVHATATEALAHCESAIGEDGKGSGTGCSAWSGDRFPLECRGQGPSGSYEGGYQLVAICTNTGTERTFTTHWYMDNDIGECEAGGDEFGGYFATPLGQFNACANGCEYLCTANCLSLGSPDPKTYGTWAQSGETCGSDTPGGKTETGGEDYCEDVGGGYEQCATSNNQVCLKTPKGNRFCWSPGEGDPKSNGSDDGADKGPPNEPPPKVPDRTDWTETHRSDFATNTGPGTFTGYGNEQDSDGDGEGDDGDDDDDNDGIDDGDDDGDGDGDGQEDEQTATLTGCGTQPTCDTTTVECNHYITAWRHRCDAHDAKASSGATCDRPPTCSHADPVQCAQLTALWRLRCDTDGTTVTGGDTCDAPPKCARSGTPSCQAALDAWKLRCAFNPKMMGTARCATYDENGNVVTAGSETECDESNATCRAIKIAHKAQCEAKEAAAKASSARKETNEKLGEAVDKLGEIKDALGGTGAYKEQCDAGPPDCSQTDLIGCSILRQQWASLCETRKLVEGVLGDGEGVGDEDIPGPEGAEADAGLVHTFNPLDGIALDGGWEGRGSCPVMVGFNFRGERFDVDPTWLCELLDLLGYLVLLSGAMVSGRILSGGWS